MHLNVGFPGGLKVKVSAWNVGDQGSIPVLGRSPGEGNGAPLQYSCLGNPVDRAAWQRVGHDLVNNTKQLKQLPQWKGLNTQLL